MWHTAVCLPCVLPDSRPLRMLVGVSAKHLYMTTMTALWLEFCVHARVFPFAPGCQPPWKQARRQRALVVVSLVRYSTSRCCLLVVCASSTLRIVIELHTSWSYMIAMAEFCPGRGPLPRSFLETPCCSCYNLTLLNTVARLASTSSRDVLSHSLNWNAASSLVAFPEVHAAAVVLLFFSTLLWYRQGVWLLRAIPKTLPLLSLCCPKLLGRPCEVESSRSQAASER